MFELFVAYVLISYSYGLAWFTYATTFDDGNCSIDKEDKIGFFAISPMWVWVSLLRYISYIISGVCCIILHILPSKFRLGNKEDEQ